MSNKFKPIEECGYGQNLLVYTTTGRPIILRKIINDNNDIAFLDLQPRTLDMENEFLDIAMPLPEPETC